MSSRMRLLIAGTILLTTCLGCTKSPAVTTSSSPSASSTISTVDTTAEEGPFDLAQQLISTKYRKELLLALEHQGDKRYVEAANVLQAVQVTKDTEEVRDQIAKVHGLQLEQASLDRILTAIRTVIEQGQLEQAEQLITQALALYTDATDAERLLSLQQQTNALLAAKNPNTTVQLTRHRQQATTAFKEKNLRAALFHFEQLLALRSDAAVQQQADDLRSKLARYDAALEQAIVLRRNPQRLEDALAVYQQAAQIWDTLSVRQELADTQLALEQRCERLAVAMFDTKGNSRLASFGRAVADELLPYFKQRYDLAKRSQTNRIFDELKIEADELLINEQGRNDLSRLIQARYLVVGSVSTVSGITIHARLFDLHTGLVVQTAKVVAPSPEEASKRLGDLAAQLLMTDRQKLAWLQESAKSEIPVAISPQQIAISSLPIYQSDSAAPSLKYSTNRPPAFGSLQIEDYERLPTKTVEEGSSVPLTLVEQERPLRNRLLAVQIELGDYFFATGQPQEALSRYQLARELEPGNLDILARINQCQQHLLPLKLTISAQPMRRERAAFLHFFVKGETPQFPAELATWAPENLSPYFATACKVVDLGEASWMMARLGLNVNDVLHDPSIRRWLGRALGVRFLIMGCIEHGDYLTVTTLMLDVEQGCETGRGKISVNNLREMKLRLPELARLTMLNPADRARLEQELAQSETDYVRAQEAYQHEQYPLALHLSSSLKKRQPLNLRFGWLVSESQDRLRETAWELARSQYEQQERTLAQQVTLRRAELLLAIDSACRNPATLPTQVLQRLHEQAQKQLLALARSAYQNKDYNKAWQLFDAAQGIRPQDEALLHEIAQARCGRELARTNSAATREAQQNEAERRESELQLAACRQQWQSERQHFQQLQLAKQNQPRKLDLAESARLLDQAQRLKTQSRFDQAAALLQAASRLNPTDEIDQLLGETLLDQARAEAKSHGAGRLVEWERRLAQESARRKQAEEQARTNSVRYQAALASAQEAELSKNYAEAIAKYQEANKLFASNSVTQRLLAAQSALDQDRERLAQQKQIDEEKARRTAELAQLLASGKAAAQSNKWDIAQAALLKAQGLDAGNIEVAAALSKVEQQKLQALPSRAQPASLDEYLAQAKLRSQAKQYEAALALLAAAQKQAPNDQQLLALITETKKLQTTDTEAIVTARKKKEDARRLAVERFEKETTARKQAEVARQQAEAALAAKDWKAAEQALKTAKKLTPNDPRLNKLAQQLADGQSVAARQPPQSLHDTDVRARQATKGNQQQGRMGELLKLAQAAIAKKDYDEAEKQLGEALSLDPTNLAVGRVQRELQTARQKEVQSKAAMSAADRKKHDEDTARKKTEFARLIKEGKEALASEDLEKATRLFTEAKALNPEDADAALLLGMARRDVDRAKAAEEAARKEAAAEKQKEKEIAKAEADSKKKTEEELRRKLEQDVETKKRADALKTLNKQAYELAMKAGKQALTAKKYNDAIAAFTQASQLMPADKEAASQLALAKKLKLEANPP